MIESDVYREQGIVGSPFRLLAAAAYHDELLSRIPQCQERVLLQSMNVEFGPYVLPVLESMIDRANDIRVKLKLDGHIAAQDSVKVTGHVISALRGARNNRWQTGRDTLKRLAKNGGEIMYSNMPGHLGFFFPFIWRNHIKLSILDNVAYVGGINLDDDNLESEDFMVAIDDPVIVAYVAGVFEEVDGPPGPDRRKSSDDGRTQVLLDRGVIGQSVITDTISEMVNSARKSIRIVSQYPPDAPMLVALKNATRRGVRVELVIQGNVHDITHILNRAFSVLPEFWHDENDMSFETVNFNGSLHGKLLLVDTEAKGGGKVLFGSHNIATSMGKRVGMTELSIASSDPLLVATMERYYEGLRKVVA